jgi:glycosyltransferase involved in cell wall biosynthesis
MPQTSNPPLVSVVIPTYNRSGLLRLAIESVLAQTYPAIEVIVVDDGSGDDTPAVAESFGDRITYIRQTNQGGAAARNAGLRVARGAYINVLDDDDLMLPAKIERQVQVLEKRPEIGVVHCGYYMIDRDGRKLERVTFLPDGTLEELIVLNPIWSGAPLMRRECIERVGGYRPLIVEDWDLWLRICLAGYRFACVQEPLGAYRMTPGSNMSNVARVERDAMSMLDDLFADPAMPAPARARRNDAYGTTCLWLSWRYYDSKQWDAAQRCLERALSFIPQLASDERFLANLLVEGAFGANIADPPRFIDTMLAHLPPSLQHLERYAPQMRAQTHVVIALRLYAQERFHDARHHLREALRLYPAILEQPEEFVAQMRRVAPRQPHLDPDQFIETVLRHLPDEARPLFRLRTRLVSAARFAAAFDDYHAGRRHRVIPHLATALRYDPSGILNRGVVAIIVKSLPDFLEHRLAAGR